MFLDVGVSWCEGGDAGRRQMGCDEACRQQLQEQGGQGFLLLGHPGGVLEGQLSAANLLLAEVNVLPELGDGIQRSIVLETQAADL